uniref:Putative Ceramide glucosyltransferase n=1 Tax=mine drainage metagenome TaxID=410659 RepID=E6QHG1_9ZZZZ
MHNFALTPWLALGALWLARMIMVLTAASMVYALLALVAAWSYRLSRRGALASPTGFAPPVSVLKPLKGHDPNLLEALRSHCMQQYAGEYELLCGVSSLDDPAVSVVSLIQEEFSERNIRLILCPEWLGANGKVSNLIQMAREAKHDFLLINDGDIRVSPRYLERVLGEFARPQKNSRVVGMVTALYRGRAERSLWSRIEALSIATDFQPGVLTARLVERGIHFALGSTLAVRREALIAAGGLEALVNDLADDYEMGARIDRAGYAIRLAPEVVETGVPAYSWRGFVSHQLRWARTVRDSRRWGYVGLLFTHTLPLAVASVIASGASLWSLWLLAMAICLRLGLAMQVGFSVLGDRQVFGDLWLLPLRDLVAFALWIASFASNVIEWRGERFVLKNGRLIPG